MADEDYDCTVYVERDGRWVEVVVGDAQFVPYHKIKPADVCIMNEKFRVTTIDRPTGEPVGVGTIEGQAGDALMRGPAGELYPCARAILDDTYRQGLRDGVQVEASTEHPAKVVRVYSDHKGEWRWSSRAANGQTLADSGEGYVDKDFAMEMAGRMNPAAAIVMAGPHDA